MHNDKWINQNIAGYVIPTEESNRKISNFHKGKPKTEEHKEKIRLSNIGKNKGKKPTAEHKLKNSLLHCGKNNIRYGVEVSQETRNRIGQANKGKVPVNKGKPMSEEQKAKIRATIAAKKLVQS